MSTAGGLRQRLPDLQTGQAELLREALAPGLERRHAACDQRHRLDPGGR